MILKFTFLYKIIESVPMGHKKLKLRFYTTHLSIDIATKLNIDDVEQITSIAI